MSEEARFRMALELIATMTGVAPYAQEIARLALKGHDDPTAGATAASGPAKEGT